MLQRGCAGRSGQPAGRAQRATCPGTPLTHWSPPCLKALQQALTMRLVLHLHSAVHDRND